MSARAGSPGTWMTLALWLAGFAALAGAAWTGGANAAGDPAAEHEMHLELAVPDGEGGWRLITVVMLLDPYVADFDAQADEARAGMLARFPGAVDLSASQGPTAEYNLSGFTWSASAASWRYNDSGRPASAANAASAIGSGANSWNNQGAAWAFTGGTSTTLPASICSGSQIDGSNVVGWAPLEGNTLGVTCWYSSAKTAVEFDMLLDSDRTWGGGLDLFTVALHEFGHALGLGHSTTGCAVPSQPVMCAYYVGAVSGPRADDVAGLIALYGEADGGSPATATPTKTKTPAPTKTATATRTATKTATPSAPSLAERQVRLTPGHNFIVWPGTDTPPGVGLAGAISGVEAVYSWDPVTQTWQVYLPGQYAEISSLDELIEGDVYWIYASREIVFTAPR